MKRFVLSLLFALMTLISVTSRAEALSCTASMISPVVFTGLDILSGASVDASSTLTVECTVNSLDGIVGSLLTVTICPNIGQGSGGSASGVRRLVSGGNILNYNIFQDSNRSVPWGHVSFPALGTVPPMTLQVTVPPLLGTNTASVSRDVYFRLFGSQQTAPPGTYQSSFAGSPDTTISIGLGLLGCAGLLSQSTTANFTVRAIIDKNCTVTTQSVNFGSVGFLSANVDGTGQVRVTCTLSTGYSVGLGVGSFTPSTRQMTNGSNIIVYGLYQDIARSQGWGNTTGLMPTGTGTGLTQNYTVFGRVAPQTTPPAGTYNDTVAVTVTY
ncbi:MAG: spore coat U domain-containing protein [Pseudomonadota bacterium]